MRTVEDRKFRTSDDYELFYRYWPAESETPSGAVALFHRGHEHSGRMAHIVDELDLPGFAFYAWDARGLGLSRKEPEPDSTSGTLIRDVQEFIAHISSTYGTDVNDIAVIGQSIGAVLVSAWAHDYAPGIRGMVLASPAFRVKLYVPFAWPGLRLAYALKGNFFVNSYVKGKFLTHDPQRIASFETDPLIVRPIAVNILLGLNDLAERIVADASAITIPTQLLISANDWVVHHGPQHRLYERLGTLTKERHLLAGFFHDTLGEKDRKLAIEKVREFLLRRFEEPIEQLSLLTADKLSFTRAEADRIASPLRRFSMQWIYWLMVRMGLRIGGWFSKGIRLGHATGFDSGSTLDYVYQNSAQGLTPLGRLIDRRYLDSIGWKGIRERKRHIEGLLQDAAERLHSEGTAVRILDIAAGHGRYILDAIEHIEVRPDSICLRDYSDLNVTAGSKLIRQRGLEDTVSFVKGDAFDRDSLATIEPNPTLGVVSGLYELFADNDMIRRSLDGLAAAIQDDGYLIYTGQPWHPQLEFIGRALTSHRQGESWVMRRRTQAELDQLVAAAGFTKLDQRIDEWGIFTVSLARKNGG